MDKLLIAQKLTTETIKKYPLEQLEEKYGCSGGELMAAIFNDVFQHVVVPNLAPDGKYYETPVILDDIPHT